MLRNSIVNLVAVLILLLISGCATLPKDFERPKSYAFTDTDNTRLVKARRDEMRAYPGQSGFLLLGNGLEMFWYRLFGYSAH